MKLILIALIACSASSAFAGNRYQEDGIAFEEYLRQQQIQDELDEINAKLDALDDIQARLNDLNDQ
jgi:hypothetical protein